MIKFLRLFRLPCCECREVQVLFWQRRCDFCGKNEGVIK